MGLIFYKNNMFSVVVGYRIDISGTIVLVYISYDMCCYCAFPCKYCRTPHKFETNLLVSNPFP